MEYYIQRNLNHRNDVITKTNNYTRMKEVKLIKMQHDLKLTQQALVVALRRLEKLEEKVFPKDEDVK